MISLAHCPPVSALQIISSNWFWVIIGCSAGKMYDEVAGAQGQLGEIVLMSMLFK